MFYNIIIILCVKIFNYINFNIMSEYSDSLPNYEILSEETTNFDFNYKIILIGDSNVGKSCLTVRATKNTFLNFYTPTVGFEFFNLIINIKGKNIKLQIWDTCGQEKFRSLINNFYHKASLAIIVYSIDNEKSFEHIEHWLNEIKSNTIPDIKIFLIGNKMDLVDLRKIKTEKAKSFCEERGLDYFIETSAKNGENVINTFAYAANLLLEESLKYQKINKDKVKINENINNKKTDNCLSFDYVEDEPRNIILDNNSTKEKKKKCCK